MGPELTPHVSLTVTDVDGAARFYSDVFGWRLVDTTPEWTEMASGPFRLYLVRDDGPSPMFAVSVDDVDDAKSTAVQRGCSVVGEKDGEVFVTDPFGHSFCLTRKA
ncbi:MAG: VOC family protein [Armatimonadetes bacterium]|nr:VOC family protein [Armatimonadota bacterium]